MLTPSMIDELISQQSAPKGAELVIEVLMLMLGGKQDWESAKIHIGDRKFIEKLTNFDKDNSGHLVPILENYMDDPRFTYDRIKKSSLSCACLANWIAGVYRYIKVFEELKQAGLLEKHEVRT